MDNISIEKYNSAIDLLRISYVVIGELCGKYVYLNSLKTALVINKNLVDVCYYENIKLMFNIITLKIDAQHNMLNNFMFFNFNKKTEELTLANVNRNNLNGIEILSELRLLEIKNCNNLTKISKNLNKLKKLKLVNISNCDNIIDLSELSIECNIIDT